MAEANTTDTSQGSQKKLELTGQWLNTLHDMTEDVNETVEQGSLVTELARTLKDPSFTGVSKHGRLESKSPTKEAIKGKLSDAAISKITGIADQLVRDKLEAFTKGKIEDTRKRVITLTATYHSIARAGVARIDANSGFAGKDYWEGAYNERIAEAIERALDTKVDKMRAEVDILKKVIAQIDINIAAAKKLIPALPTASRILVNDLAIHLVAFNIKGLTQDLVQLICEVAIGMMGLSSELTRMQFEAPGAAKVLKFQLQSYNATIDALQKGHEAKLQEAADWIRSHPNDVPRTADKGLAGLLDFLIRRGKK